MQCIAKLKIIINEFQTIPAKSLKDCLKSYVKETRFGYWRLATLHRICFFIIFFFFSFCFSFISFSLKIVKYAHINLSMAENWICHVYLIPHLFHLVDEFMFEKWHWNCMICGHRNWTLNIIIIFPVWFFFFIFAHSQSLFQFLPICVWHRLKLFFIVKLK